MNKEEIKARYNEAFEDIIDDIEEIVGVIGLTETINEFEPVIKADNDTWTVTLQLRYGQKDILNLDIESDIDYQQAQDMLIRQIEDIVL